MRSRIAPLFKLLYNPTQAMREIIPAAPYGVGVVLAFISTFLYYDLLSGNIGRVLYWTVAALGRSEGPSPTVVLIHRITQRVSSSASPVIFIALIFVPACALAASLIERRASFTVLLQREYAGLVSAALYAWAISHLVMLIPAALLSQNPTNEADPIVQSVLRLVPLPYFLFLLTIGIRTTLTSHYGGAIGCVALAACSLILLPLLPNFFFLLTSPFVLIFVILLLRNFLGDALSAQRSRESFRQNLEAATLNPADASAHYNLGLIYLQRHQYAEAQASFAKAVEIDPDEVDAHYQLGRIAREEGRYAEAISHFDSVVRRSENHAQGEVWREIGRTYYEASQYDDALAAFERFLEKRPSDPEGLYRYGLTLHKQGRVDQAIAQMQTCIQSVRTLPSYKYRLERRWMTDAEAFLRSAGDAVSR